MASETPPLAEAITGNVKAQRARMKLKQADVAARMQAFGLKWHYQTVGAVERGERPITAEELIWLAVCLQTIPAVLMQPQSNAVRSPSGLEVPAQRLNASDDSVTWDGNVPKISPEPGRMPLPERRFAELEELIEFARDLRRQARREPQEEEGSQEEAGSQEETAGAEDIPPRRSDGKERKRSR